MEVDFWWLCGGADGSNKLQWPSLVYWAVDSKRGWVFGQRIWSPGPIHCSHPKPVPPLISSFCTASSQLFRRPPLMYSLHCIDSPTEIRKVPDFSVSFLMWWFLGMINLDGCRRRYTAGVQVLQRVRSQEMTSRISSKADFSIFSTIAMIFWLWGPRPKSQLNRWKEGWHVESMTASSSQGTRTQKRGRLLSVNLNASRRS